MIGEKERERKKEGRNRESSSGGGSMDASTSLPRTEEWESGRGRENDLVRLVAGGAVAEQQPQRTIHNTPSSVSGYIKFIFYSKQS